MTAPTFAWNSGDAFSDQFPAGLRVLVVDNDPTNLRILEKMLISCLYEVTKCDRAEVALNLLRNNTNRFDIVISEVHMPGVDGFRLLEQVGLEIDLPVIMMSGDGRNDVVMKGVTHGACDYLIKPVEIHELKNIWQHVIRTRKQKQHKEGNVVVDCSSLANEGNWKDSDDTPFLKKPSLVWSVELHQQFVAAVNHLGIAKATPKKILGVMNVPGLTRENVASHLQKYRLYLRRLSGGSLDVTFGSMPLLGGIDLQAFASTGQIPAQSVASVEELGRPNAKPHICIPVDDHLNLFSFENPKKLASLKQSAQTFCGNVTISVLLVLGGALLGFCFFSTLYSSF